MNKPNHTDRGLPKSGKENPFSIPDRYFEDFPTRLNEKIHAENPSSIHSGMVLNWKPYLAAAVIFIVALLSTNYLVRTTGSKRAEKIFHAEISRAVEQELYSISEETILEVYKTDSQNEQGKPVISPEEAIDYLMNESLNEDEIINAL